MAVARCVVRGEELEVLELRLEGKSDKGKFSLFVVSPLLCWNMALTV